MQTERHMSAPLTNISEVLKRRGALLESDKHCITLLVYGVASDRWILFSTIKMSLLDVKIVSIVM